MKLNFFTLLLISLGSIQTLHAQMLRTNIILNMPFNGDVSDYSGNQVIGTVMDGSLALDRFATTQSAYFFDGVDDLIEIPHDETLKPELPVTISMWIYPEEVGSPNNKLFSSDDHPDFYSGITVQIHPEGGGVIACSYGSGGGSGYSNRRSVFGNTVITPQVWTHVVVVLRGPQDMDIYINGIPETVTYTGNGGPLVYTESPARIGAFDGNVNGPMVYYNGSIDDLKMWDEALSSEEIRMVYDELIWDMPIISNTLDYSGNMIDGNAVFATPTEDRFGNLGSAYGFDGNISNIIIPDHSMFKPQLPVSISFWVNTDDIDYPDNLIFTNDDHPNFYSGLSARIDHQGAGTVSFTYGTGGGSGPNNRRTVLGSTAMEAQKWYHVVGIMRAPQDMDVYVNGEKEEVTYSGNGGNMIYTDSPGRIGAFDGNSIGDTKYFQGKLDEFKMWNRAITEEEIAGLFTPASTTSVEETDNTPKSNTRIFPNPTSETIQVVCPEKACFDQYQLFNISGQLMQQGNPQNTISVKSLESGIYFIKLQSGNQMHIQHFVKS